MLKNKYLISILIIIILILIITGIIYTYRYNVLKNDNNQINVLYSIFNEICNEDENINLNNSALINFITGKEFKDKSLLLELENKNTTGENVILSIKYNKKENILTVCKENYNNTYSYVQNYKISVKFNKIEYQKYGDFSETFLYK